MRSFRSDLAVEARALSGGTDIPGVRMEQLRLGELTETVVEIVDERGAAALGKPCGRYVTLESPQLALPEAELSQMAIDRLAHTLSAMLPELGAVLVIGLGNRRITADSLGPRVVDNVLVTRHMRETTPQSVKGRLRCVSAVSPGVLGVTGLETAEVVQGIVEHAKPEAVIAVDALAARETSRICATLQVSDTGIQPGSGVGNHRLGLNAEDGDHAAALDAMVDRVVEKRLGDLVVTPREVDERVAHMAQMLSEGVNRALQSRLSPAEIPALMN